MARAKPKKSARKMAQPIQKKKLYKTTEVKNIKDFPERYLMLPSDMGVDQEKLARHIAEMGDRLVKRGLRIKEPVHLYRYTRITQSVELALELEEVK